VHLIHPHTQTNIRPLSGIGVSVRAGDAKNNAPTIKIPSDYFTYAFFIETSNNFGLNNNNHNEVNCASTHHMILQRLENKSHFLEPVGFERAAQELGIELLLRVDSAHMSPPKAAIHNSAKLPFTQERAASRMHPSPRTHPDLFVIVAQRHPVAWLRAREGGNVKLTAFSCHRDSFPIS